jgi:uncharacterized delta-60 repeat protein
MPVYAGLLGLCAQAQSDVLDPTFGNGGIVYGDPGFPSQAYALAQQADGKLVVAGSAYWPNGGFLVVRYTATGELDSTFDADGYVVTPFDTISPYPGDILHAVAIQADGKIVVGGRSYHLGSYTYRILARYLQDGSLDPSFGDAGIVASDPEGLDGDVFSILIQPDGHILAVGGSTLGFELARYDAEGHPDPEFSGDGVAYFPSPVEGDALDGALLPDGRILVVGWGNPDLDQDLIRILRVLPNGELDPSFGNGGEVYDQFSNTSNQDPAFAVALAPEGKFVVAGTTRLNGLDRSLFIARYLEDGSLDPSFDVEGHTMIWADMEQGTGPDIVLDDNGRILVSSYGTNGADFDFIMHRLLPDGTPDYTFGTDGAVLTDIAPGSQDLSTAMLMQADGRVVLAGRGSAGMALARYLPASEVGMAECRPDTTRLNVYPNPATDDVTIRPVDHTTNGRITLCSQTGGIIREWSLRQDPASTYDLRGVVPGVYHVKLTTSRSMHVARLVVIGN